MPDPDTEGPTREARVDPGYDWRCGCEPWSPDPTCPTHGPAQPAEAPEGECECEPTDNEVAIQDAQALREAAAALREPRAVEGER